MSGLDWEKASRREAVGPPDRPIASAPRPTHKQMVYLKRLAKQAGIKEPKPQTRHDASTYIESLHDHMGIESRPWPPE